MKIHPTENVLCQEGTHTHTHTMHARRHTQVEAKRKYKTHKQEDNPEN